MLQPQVLGWELCTLVLQWHLPSSQEGNIILCLLCFCHFSIPFHKVNNINSQKLTFYFYFSMMETSSEEGSEVWISCFRHIWGFGQEKVHFSLPQITAQKTAPFWSWWVDWLGTSSYHLTCLTTPEKNKELSHSNKCLWHTAVPFPDALKMEDSHWV